MYTKITCSCHVELSTGYEHVLCSNSTYKTFLCSSVKRKTKKCQWISKVLQYLQLQYICHAFSIQQVAMFVYKSIEVFNRIFFSTREMFLYIKNEIVENKFGKFLIYRNIHFIVSTNRTFRDFAADLGKHRVLPENPEKLR